MRVRSRLKAALRHPSSDLHFVVQTYPYLKAVQQMLTVIFQKTVRPHLLVKLSPVQGRQTISNPI